MLSEHQKKLLGLVAFCLFFVATQLAYAEPQVISDADYGYSIRSYKVGKTVVCKTERGDNDRVCKVIDETHVEFLSPVEFKHITEIKECGVPRFVASHGRADPQVLLNEEGKVIPIAGNARPKYSIYSSCGNGLIRISESGRYGFIDADGKFAIAPKFKMAREFNEGLAVASVDGKTWGYIGKNGSIIIPAIYDCDSNSLLDCGRYADFSAVMKHTLTGSNDEAAKSDLRFAVINSKSGCFHIDTAGLQVFGNRSYLRCSAVAWATESIPAYTLVEFETDTWAAVDWNGKTLTSLRKFSDRPQLGRQDDFDYKGDGVVLIDSATLPDGRIVCVNAKDELIDVAECNRHRYGSGTLAGATAAEDDDFSGMLLGIAIAFLVALLGLIYGIYRVVKRWRKSTPR